MAFLGVPIFLFNAFLGDPILFVKAFLKGAKGCLLLQTPVRQPLTQSIHISYVYRGVLLRSFLRPFKVITVDPSF